MGLTFLLGIIINLIQPNNMVYNVTRIEFNQPERWLNAPVLADFVYPWEDTEAPYTSFQAVYDEYNFYFKFLVQDEDIYAPGDIQDKRGVLPSDRVEIFFKSNHSMDPYYCLEMDPRGRVLDYLARFYRITDFDWEWPEPHLKVKASIQDKGYTVEGQISLQSLRDFSILSADGSMEAGLFRGDAYHVDAQTTDIKWISWIRPTSEKPDFHLPSAFGKLQLIP